MKLNTDLEAAKTGNPILLDVGLPWLVVGAWNKQDQQFVYASFQGAGDETEWDCWFETEWTKEKDSKGKPNIKGWMEIPGRE